MLTKTWWQAQGSWSSGGQQPRPVRRHGDRQASHRITDDSTCLMKECRKRCSNF